MEYRARIVACARSFLGMRFVHQGRTEQGVDCLGLLLAVAQQMGILFEGLHPLAMDVPTYSLRPDVQLLRQKLDYFLVPIPIPEADAGDVVLLTIQGMPQHLAILSDYPESGLLGMIHSYASARKVVEHRYDEEWQRATEAAYRVPQTNHH